MAKKVTKSTTEKPTEKQVSLIIDKPLLSEKATMLGVHAFAVSPKANKALIKAEIKRLYQVTPRRVNIINLLGKKVMMRGKLGQRPGMKKAVVYLKSGDKINLA